MATIKYLETKIAEVIERPLWWQTAGLQETASGYGSKLRTSKMVRLEGDTRFRRVYVVCWSNSGTAYVILNKVPQYFISHEPLFA